MSSYSCCTPSKVEFKQVNTLSKLLKLASDSSRLKILCILRSGEHCVCEILDHVELSQSLVSHHLKDLKDAGIIQDMKKGLYVHYSLTIEGKRITDLLFKI